MTCTNVPVKKVQFTTRAMFNVLVPFLILGKTCQLQTVIFEESLIYYRSKMARMVVY